MMETAESENIMALPKKVSNDPRAVARTDYFEVNYLVIPKDAKSEHAGTEWVQIELNSRNTMVEFAELPAVVEFNNMLFLKTVKTANRDNTADVAHYKKVDGGELARAVRMIYVDPKDLLSYPNNIPLG